MTVEGSQLESLKPLPWQLALFFRKGVYVCFVECGSSSTWVISLVISTYVPMYGKSLRMHIFVINFTSRLYNKHQNLMWFLKYEQLQYLQWLCNSVWVTIQQRIKIQNLNQWHCLMFYVCKLYMISKCKIASGLMNVLHEHLKTGMPWGHGSLFRVLAHEKFQVSSLLYFLRFTVANNMRCMYNISNISAWQ